MSKQLLKKLPEYKKKVFDNLVTGDETWVTFNKNVVLKQLRKNMRNLRPKSGLQHVKLLHDNAPAHKASVVVDFFTSENVNMLPHQPYSPDLAPCDFFLFPKLKKHLSGRRYRSRSASGSAIHQYLIGVPKEEY